MKTRANYSFWIISLALGLMLLIYLAQVYTNRNIAGLKVSNQEAAVTFTVHNRMAEIVNVVFAIDSRLSTYSLTKKNIPNLRDSFTLVGYNSSVLEKLNLDSQSRKMFHEMNLLVGKHVTIGNAALDEIEKDNKPEYIRLTDSLLEAKLSDSIYNVSLKISKQFENKLQTTLARNTQSSKSLSSNNRLLALIAIAAILILATIIIYRHLQQLQLIIELEKANNKALESVIIKEQFLANMSHEIRTPLNAIKGFSGLMLKTELQQDQKQYAEIIENSSNNLLQIVNDVLDISKMETGNLNLQIQQFNLKSILIVLEQMFRNSAIEKNISFEWQVDENVPLDLKGDADRLNQILINLVSNAIKFTNKGYVKITIKKSGNTGDMVWLQFCIEDSGVGISEEKKDKIFERFYQVSGSSNELQKGTGLGLAIVKNLTGLMGGKVEVESQIGKGSLFTLSLPFEINKEIRSKNSNDKILIDDLTFSGVKLLVAEDNNVNQLLVKYLLERYGIHPVVVQNGKELIEILRQETFDLLLLDIQMPVLNGYQAMEKIQEMKLSLPVIAMTAYVMRGEKEKCLAAGMSEYLAKPIREEKLQELLIKFLEHKKVNNVSKNSNENGSFLLNLAGGDNEMANIILKEIKNELKTAVTNLEKINADGVDIQGLRSFCHHLVSTISPLGNETPAMEKTKNLQMELTGEKNVKKIQALLNELKTELSQMELEQLIL